MNIESEVIALVEQYDGHVFFSKRFLQIAPETDLFKDMKLANEDAIELFQEYGEKFGVDITDISFTRYFPNEKGMFDFFTAKNLKGTGHSPEPITVAMLIESAKVGKWLYD